MSSVSLLTKKYMHIWYISNVEDSCRLTLHTYHLSNCSCSVSRNNRDLMLRWKVVRICFSPSIKYRTQATLFIERYDMYVCTRSSTAGCTKVCI